MLLVCCRAVLRAHKAALYAIRAFWKQLLHSSVAFNNLTKAFAKIQSTKSAADRAYQTMLERYPSNIRVRVCGSSSTVALRAAS